jgi:hypothetical protein
MARLLTSTLPSETDPLADAASRAVNGQRKKHS